MEGFRMNLAPVDPEGYARLVDRNHDIQLDDSPGNWPANLQLPMPELPSPGDPDLSPYDRLMQLFFISLVLAARGEIVRIPCFGPGTKEEAINRGWLRCTESHPEKWDYWGAKLLEIWVYELMVTKEGALGPTGLFFAIPEEAYTFPVGVRQGHEWA